MHRRMPKKVYIITVTIIAVFALMVSGCTKERDTQEELTELTESGEVPGEESDKIPSEESGEIPDKESGTGTEESLGSVREESLTDAAGTICIHVCGEVASPGVYELTPGSRLYEVIAAAGGLTDNAAGEKLNQAAIAEDGQQVYVPSKEEAAQGGAENQEAPSSGMSVDDGRLSLNTASKEQLMTLSGIGEAKAAAIISYREEHGGFQKIEELMEVEGIKEGVFNKVKDKIRI